MSAAVWGCEGLRWTSPISGLMRQLALDPMRYHALSRPKHCVAWKHHHRLFDINLGHVPSFLSYHYHLPLTMSSTNHDSRSRTYVQVSRDPASIAADASSSDDDAPDTSSALTSGAVAPHMRDESSTNNVDTDVHSASTAPGAVWTTRAASSGLAVTPASGTHPSPNAPLDHSALMSPRSDGLRRAALKNMRATTPMTIASESAPVTPPPRSRTASESHELNNQVDTTPHGPSARNGVLDSDRAPEVEEQLLKELGHIPTTSLDFLYSLYDDTATVQDIDSFLDLPETPFKRKKRDTAQGRWAGIPQSPKREEKIYPPLTAVFQAIIAHFGNNLTDSSDVGVVREIVDTHDTSLVNENKTKSRPDYIVRAEGPSFELPTTTSQRIAGHETLGYTNTAAVFEVKMERTRGSDVQQVGQLARYCE